MAKTDKITVLGGLGKMCASTSIDLALNSNFSEILIADIDIENGNKLVNMLNNPRVKFKKLDASSIDSIIEACIQPYRDSNR